MKPRISTSSNHRRTVISPLMFLLPFFLLLLNDISTPCQAKGPFHSVRIWGRHRGGTRTHTTPSSVLPSESSEHEHGSSFEANSNDSQAPASDALSENNAPSTNASYSVPIDIKNETIPEWKRQLPPPLCNKRSRTFQRICVPYQDQMAEIYLLGTAHVSNDSSADVRLLLGTLRPDVIFVELCDQRTSMLEAPSQICRNTTKPFWQKVSEVQLQNNHSRLQSMATVLLTQTQEEYADSLGVELGGEFRVAYQYWRSFPPRSTTFDADLGLPVRPHLILGDRPLAITLARAWESLSWWGKCKVLIGLIVSSFHKPKPEELRQWIQSILDDETDLLSSSLDDLRKHFPTLERVIIRERDAYMACKLYQLCRGLLVSAARSSSSANPTDNTQQQQEQQPRRPIVIAALVGAGHVPGICEWLTTKTHPQGPEDLLATLIATKKFEHEDLSQLIYDVTELTDGALPTDYIPEDQ